MGVCGTSNNSVISGVLVCRGDDILPVVQTGPDWESFTYQKLSLDSEEDAKFIEKSFDWTLEVDGKTWADGKLRIAYRLSTSWSVTYQIRVELQARTTSKAVNCATHSVRAVTQPIVC
jgi:hypothetical protein